MEQKLGCCRVSFLVSLQFLRYRSNVSLTVRSRLNDKMYVLRITKIIFFVIYVLLNWLMTSAAHSPSFEQPPCSLLGHLGTCKTKSLAFDDKWNLAHW